VQLKEKEEKVSEKTRHMDQAERVKVEQSFRNYSQKLKSAWEDRLIGCYRSSFTYRKLSTVRALIFDPQEYFSFYYELCEIFIKEKKVNKCVELIEQIKKRLGPEGREQKEQLVHLLEIKLNFSVNHIKELASVARIEEFLEKHAELDRQKIGELYFLSGIALHESNPEDRSVHGKILELIQKSTSLSNTYREWYLFSFFNLEFAQMSDRAETVEKYVLNALQALINSLKAASHENEYYLQSYLKLLNLLCNHSNRFKSVYALFEEEYRQIPVEGWINVVPQMIAQLYQGEGQHSFVKIIKILLKQLGEHHPESVLYSLHFALKSKIPERVRPAQEIVDHIRMSNSELAEEVERISSELVRAAIKLKEYWYDSIESAWTNYNQNKNAGQVIVALRELCETVLGRRESNSEISFHQEFGQEIRDGYQWLLRYEQTGHATCLSQVFETFYGIYKKVKDSFDNVRKVYLKNVAPFLVTSKKYRSCIPGLYEPHRRCTKITGFCNELVILQSKQRPRKLTVFGDDGKEYNFLLKGREDLRLDERVMQFFSLVNKLLARERENLRRNLEITRYSIVPLTVNTGLIGWVENCDTLNELIKEYRSVNKIRIYVEKELYEKIYPDYAYLPVINKLEIFKTGLESTQGKDLQRILWMKSPNSEAWVDKRNNYTCSLATMSIVGYILGLGDRHPSNIMLNRHSAKIVHIDFGDCFEVAALRDKFPERVPFRLTRMLQKAMGIPGIHGLYRFTCEKVMRLLRESKESLYGVLETFAQDPIISWRLTHERKEEPAVAVAAEPPKNLNEEVIGSMMEGLNIEMGQERRKYTEESPQRSPQTTNNREQINEKAVKALERVKQKLKGTDFNEHEELTVEQQVSRLIQEASSSINICQSWPGWCPFW
jgi:serine/threonine-protein kinase mTOR